MKRFVFTLAVLLLATVGLAAEAAPPEIHELQDRVLRVTFPPGADQVCVFLQRQVQQEPDASTNADGYYTPASCMEIGDPDLQEVDDNIWNMVMPWFEYHHEPEATWLVWAVISYPAADGTDTSIPTAVSSVVR